MQEIFLGKDIEYSLFAWKGTSMATMSS